MICAFVFQLSLPHSFFPLHSYFELKARKETEEQEWDWERERKKTGRWTWRKKEKNQSFTARTKSCKGEKNERVYQHLRIRQMEEVNIKRSWGREGLSRVWSVSKLCSSHTAGYLNVLFKCCHILSLLWNAKPDDWLLFIIFQLSLQSQFCQVFLCSFSLCS